jgi:hypothetical protein
MVVDTSMCCTHITAVDVHVALACRLTDAELTAGGCLNCRAGTSRDADRREFAGLNG